jgi:serine/threonine-protein kinase
MTMLSDAAVTRLRAVATWPEFDTERYVVTGEIGRGGMGTVYSAFDAELGRQVAIKVSNTLASPSTAQRLGTEARVLARLEHPGIVPVHDVGRLADGRLFYVMKKVEGRTLSEHIRDHAEPGERLRIFERICETVAFAHAQGILHRDLKPDNVMVGAFGEVTIVDWGVAKLLTAPEAGEPHDHTVIGTYGFMAPEQVRGESSRLDQRADVYALGAILLTLLAPQASIPGPLRSICARALAPSPADRYPSAAALGEDVGRYRSGRAVTAHRETVVERGWRLAKVYRTPLLLVLAYMVMRALVALFVGR